MGVWVDWDRSLLILVFLVCISILYLVPSICILVVSVRVVSTALFIGLQCFVLLMRQSISVYRMNPYFEQIGCGVNRMLP